MGFVFQSFQLLANLTAREIPFLTNTPMTPVRAWRTGLARPANFHTGFSLRSTLLPGYFGQNAVRLCGFVATRIAEAPAGSVGLFGTLPAGIDSAAIVGRATPSPRVGD